jgi:tyramine---L-glutamate ligase
VRTRFAVLEAVSAGLCGDRPEPSLLAEGQAMWCAVVEDLSQIPSCDVVTIVDARLVTEAAFATSVEVHRVTSSVIDSWNALRDAADGPIIIAPETDGLLEQLVTAAEGRPQLKVWNASSSAIRLTTDKFALAQHLTANAIPTLSTTVEIWDEPPTEPCVIKPRDGAGSWLVRCIDEVSTWQRVRDEFATTAPQTTPLRQPFVRGRALSVAAWFGEGFVDWLPVGEQRLSDDGRFQYQGGRLPAALTPVEASAVLTLAQAAAATIPGLRGYIGFDVLQPMDQPLRPLLVEINPRFTTSYVGYRRLLGECLLSRWLTGRMESAATMRMVEFDASGRIRDEAGR